MIAKEICPRCGKGFLEEILMELRDGDRLWMKRCNAGCDFGCESHQWECSSDIERMFMKDECNFSDLVGAA